MVPCDTNVSKLVSINRVNKSIRLTPPRILSSHVLAIYRPKTTFAALSLYNICTHPSRDCSWGGADHLACLIVMFFLQERVGAYCHDVGSLVGCPDSQLRYLLRCQDIRVHVEYCHTGFLKCGGLGPSLLPRRLTLLNTVSHSLSRPTHVLAN